MAVDRCGLICYTTTKIYDRARISGRVGKSSSSSSSSSFLQNVPWDIWLSVARFLELSDQVALSLVCKRLTILLRKCWPLLKKDCHQRLLFLRRLDSLLPGHRFCSACLKYHRRDRKDERRWLRTQSRNVCGERGIPLGNGAYVHWPSIQLALRSRYYGSSKYGLRLDSMPAELESTLDDTEDIRWKHTLHYWTSEGRLMLAVDSFRRFHGDHLRLSQFCRGYLIDVVDNTGTSTLHVRRFIDAASTDAWLHTKLRGWCPSLNDTHPFHFWSTAHWDPRAGLPGLHWTELSAERRAHGIPEWSNWRYDNKTGLPIDPKLSLLPRKTHKLLLLSKG